MNEYEKFLSECDDEIYKLGTSQDLKLLSFEWMSRVSELKYSYHFEWLGRPIIQFPQDVIALQEIIWEQKPDLIIETGVAHGGSLILSASMLALLDMFDFENGLTTSTKRQVIGIDIEIRKHNLDALKSHPLSNRIDLIEGSSVSSDVLVQVKDKCAGFERVMVILDSNHTHQHVLEELNLYSNLVSTGQYLIVFDTVIEKFPIGSFNNRSWDVGNNPYTAVTEFLEFDKRFEVDVAFENKLLITVAPNGYLRKICD